MTKVKDIESENNTPYLFEWVCDDCLDRARSPRVCKIISVDKPGCGLGFLCHDFKRSLEPVQLLKRVI